jgi:hypothetical protein
MPQYFRVAQVVAACAAFCFACTGEGDGAGSGGATQAAGLGGSGSGGAGASGGTKSMAGTSGAGTSGLTAGTSAGGTSGSNSGASGGGGSGGVAGTAGIPASGSAGTGGTAGAGGSGRAGEAGSIGTAGRGGRAGGSGQSGEGGGGASAGAGGAGGGGATTSEGCGKAPTLKSSASTSNFTYNMITSGGASRRYILRLPDDYDNERAYRLILGFHGATNNAGHVAGNPAYFGLYALANGSTIFVAPEAVDGIWSATNDLTYVDDVLEEVKNDLCIDTTQVLLEGFSQGAAMVRTLSCARPNVFRAAVGHSAGGLAVPTSCEPIAYFGSLGLDENGGQTTQTDYFAMTNGCTVATLAGAPSGGHLCSDYAGCSAGHPVRWCPYDGGHTPSPADAGMSSSWMPAEVWAFFSQF